MSNFSLACLSAIILQLCLVFSSQAQLTSDSSWTSAAKWLSDQDVSRVLNEIYETHPTSQEQLPILTTTTDNYVNIDYLGENYQLDDDDIKPDFTNNPYDLHETSSGWGNSSGGDGVACFETKADKQLALKSLREQGYLSHADKERINSLQLYEMWELQNPWHDFQDLDHFSFLLTDQGPGLLSVNDALATLYYGITHPEDRTQFNDYFDNLIKLRIPKDTLVGLLTNALQHRKNLAVSVQDLILDIAPNKADAQTMTQFIEFYRESVRKNLRRYKVEDPYQISSRSSQQDARQAFLNSFKTQAPSLALRFEYFDKINSVRSHWRPSVLKDVTDSCNMEDYERSGRIDSVNALQCQYHNQLLESHPTCMKVQLAHRVSYSQGSEHLPQTVVHYDRWLYENKLSPADQKLLQFHEYFYVLGSEIGHRNSDDIRRIIRIQAHPLFRDLLSKGAHPRLRQKLSALLYNWALGDYNILGDQTLIQYARKQGFENSKGLQLFSATSTAFRKMRRSNSMCEALPSAEVRTLATKLGFSTINHRFCEYYFHEINDKRGFFTNAEAFIYVAFFLHGRFDDAVNTEALMSFNLERPNHLSLIAQTALQRTCAAIKGGGLFDTHSLQSRIEVLNQAELFCESQSLTK